MRAFHPFGLKGSMVSILFIIGKRKGIDQKSISEALILDASTMSRDIKKLVSKGWVQTKKAQDSRKTELCLTKSGYLLLEEISPIWHNLHHKVEEVLGSENINQIDKLTTKLTNHLEEIRH